MARVDRTERLLNVVFCLLGASRAIPRWDIRRLVAGYDVDASDAAFERMFERDKDELRGMGIPVETVLDVNGEVEGYLIARQTTPEDLNFSAEELALLVWQPPPGRKQFWKRPPLQRYERLSRLVAMRQPFKALNRSESLPLMRPCCLSWLHCASNM